MTLKMEFFVCVILNPVNPVAVQGNTLADVSGLVRGVRQVGVASPATFRQTGGA